MVHRAHHHRRPCAQRHRAGRSCRGTWYRDVRGSTADTAARVRQNLTRRDVLELALKIGAVLGDGGTEELIGLYLGGAPGKVVGEKVCGGCGVGIDTNTEPVADDLGDVRVVVMRPVDAEPAELVVEIGVRVGVCRRRQADCRCDGGDTRDP